MAITEHAGATKIIDGIPLTPKELIDIGPQPKRTIEEERTERKQELAACCRLGRQVGS